MRKNKDDQVLERRARVAQLHRQGLYQYEIAADVGVSESQITLDLKAIREEWKDSAIRDFDAAKAVELAKIDGLEREHWLAWEKSKTDYTKRSVKRKNVLSPEGDAIPGTTAEERKKEKIISFGDPRFLAGVMDCIKKRCDILGLNAPTKSDVTSGGKPIEQSPAVDWLALPIEARDKILEALGLNGDGDEPEGEEE